MPHEHQRVGLGRQDSFAELSHNAADLAGLAVFGGDELSKGRPVENEVLAVPDEPSVTNALEQLVDVAVRTSSEANGVESIRRLDKAAEAGFSLTVARPSR